MLLRLAVLILVAALAAVPVLGSGSGPATTPTTSSLPASPGQRSVPPADPVGMDDLVPRERGDALGLAVLAGAGLVVVVIARRRSL